MARRILQSRWALLFATMASYRNSPTRTDRAQAITAVAAVHLGMAGLVLLGDEAGGPTPPVQAPTQLIDITLPPPPPPPPPPEPAVKSRREAGSAGRKAEPAPIVLPPPRIVLPALNPLPVAPVAGKGNAESAGAASTGTGPGAGGSGEGRGGGGAGAGGGEGIGADARLLSGGLNRRDYRYLRSFSAPGGRAVLAILIGPSGRVIECSTRQTSGDAALDAALCDMLQSRMRWAPARDRSGRPLTVGILYTAVWSRD